MGFLFGKKKMVQSLAEVLENGRDKMNQEMSKTKYNSYSGAEPTVNVAVRIHPEGEAPFETSMKAPLTKSFLLLPGVKVTVEYQSGKAKEVTLIDQPQEILDRNAAILKKE